MGGRLQTWWFRWSKGRFTIIRRCRQKKTFTANGESGRLYFRPPACKLPPSKTELHTSGQVLGAHPGPGVSLQWGGGHLETKVSGWKNGIFNTPSFIKHDYRLKAPGLVASGLKTNLFSIHREHWELWGWQGPCANNNDNLILKEGYLIKLTIKKDHIHDLVYLLQMWRRWHKVQSHSWRICDEDGGDGDDDDNDDDFKDDQHSGQDNNLRVYLQAERRRQEERQDPIERTPGWR